MRQLKKDHGPEKYSFQLAGRIVEGIRAMLRGTRNLLAHDLKHRRTLEGKSCSTNLCINDELTAAQWALNSAVESHLHTPNLPAN
jgi:hypothetical protein